MKNRSEPIDAGENASGAVFATTRWSVVFKAGQADGAQRQQALAELCRAYWYPLYAFLRRQGRSTEDAQDLTQAFFARLLGTNALRQVVRDKGRFRAFLLVSLKHFLCDEYDKSRAQKRGGGVEHIACDAATAEERYRLEPADVRSPDRIYERRWALTVLERAARRLSEAYRAEGKAGLHEQLEPFLSGDRTAPAYSVIGSRLGLSESAVKSAIHRLRRRHRELIRAEVAQTVSTAAEVDDEIRQLISILAA